MCVFTLKLARWPSAPSFVLKTKLYCPDYSRVNTSFVTVFNKTSIETIDSRNLTIPLRILHCSQCCTAQSVCSRRTNYNAIDDAKFTVWSKFTCACCTDVQQATAWPLKSAKSVLFNCLYKQLPNTMKQLPF